MGFTLQVVPFYDTLTYPVSHMLISHIQNFGTFNLQYNNHLLHNLTFTGPCIVINSYNERQGDALFLYFIW